tara:strand:- start:42 stop:506 length:465 start_codon:yes stop_codon:yes gene_type:complete
MKFTFNNKQFEINEIDSTKKIKDIINNNKEQIETTLETTITSLLLIYNGILLDTENTVEYYNIKNETIQFINNKFKKNILVSKLLNTFEQLLDNLSFNSDITTPVLNSTSETEITYENELLQLKNMGFNNETQNLSILQLVNGNIDKALVYLTE